jgi:hypothetical protein
MLHRSVRIDKGCFGSRARIREGPRPRLLCPQKRKNRCGISYFGSVPNTALSKCGRVRERSGKVESVAGGEMCEGFAAIPTANSFINSRTRAAAGLAGLDEGDRIKIQMVDFDLVETVMPVLQTR